MPTIQLVALLLQAATQLGPQLQADFQKGNVSPEDQAKLRAAVEALIKSGFTGPEWQVV